MLQIMRRPPGRLVILAPCWGWPCSTGTPGGRANSRISLNERKGHCSITRSAGGGIPKSELRRWPLSADRHFSCPSISSRCWFLERAPPRNSTLANNLPDIPREEWPRFQVGGWAQGAAREWDSGRIVVLGEAAMCSAQLRGEERAPVGMNHPQAGENAQFFLNAVRWLTRVFPEAEKKHLFGGNR